jgi:glycerol kinase
MAYQTADVVDVMVTASGQQFTELRVDGGASSNDLLCRFQADVLGVPVVRPRQTETTVLGVALLAGLGAGVWDSLADLDDVWRLDRRFAPQMLGAERTRLRAGWREAVARSRGWSSLVDPALPSPRAKGGAT